VLGAIVLGVFAVLVFVFMRACMGGGCDKAYCSSDRDLAAPEGFERVSKVLEYDPGRAAIPGALFVRSHYERVRANLSVYRYVEETKTWEPVASAEADAGGKVATATLSEAPAAIAVLRRLSPAGHVVAYLPKGETLHESAAGKITLLHTLDFTPSADGGIAGDATTIQGNTKFDVYPVVSANAANRPTRRREHPRDAREPFNHAADRGQGSGVEPQGHRDCLPRPQARPAHVFRAVHRGALRRPPQGESETDGHAAASPLGERPH
jgi:hypothetical protein